MANPVVRGVVRTPVRSSSFRIGARLPEPITFMPLTSTLELIRGVGPAVFTRSTIATFVDKDDGLVKTSPVSGGNVQARFEKEGLLMEGPTDNEALHNRDFAQASVWSPTGITPLKDAVGADGIANSASTLTATANNGVIFQIITKLSVENTYSVDVRRKTGSGTIEITDDGGLSFTAISINPLTYSRFEITATQANPSIGFRMGISGDEIEVDYAGLEALRSATSRIETAAIAVSRTQDTLQIPVANVPSDADFTISVDVIVNDIGSNQRFWGLNGIGTTRVGMVTAGNVRFDYSGTGDTTAGVGFDNLFNVVMAYDKDGGVAGEFNNYIDGVIDANAPIAVTANASAIAVVHIGASQGGTEPLYGHLRNFKVWDIQLNDPQVKAI